MEGVNGLMNEQARERMHAHVPGTLQAQHRHL